MPIESATLLHQLDATFPFDADPLANASNHLRLIKSVLKSTFPNINAAVTATDEDLNGAAAALAALSAATMKLSAASQTVTGDVSVTGFLNAATVREGGNRLVPPGVIVMWSGSLAAIPAGWALCNGSNGTPDLRDRFVLGAGGGSSVAATGGAASVTTTSTVAGSHSHGGTTASAGSHTHGASTSSVSLTVDQLPSHTHTASVSTDGAHGHGIGGTGGSGGGILSSWQPGNTNNYILQAGGTDQFITSVTGAHTHTVSIAAVGIGAPHLHGISEDGSHTHNITADSGHAHSVTFDNRPPFFALAFIMKL